MDEGKEKKERTNTVLEVQNMRHAVGVQIKPATVKVVKEEPHGK